MSHSSWVQTLVKAAGKKSSTVFFLPKLLLSFTSTRPAACLDLRLKSGALLPTVIGIVLMFLFMVITDQYLTAYHIHDRHAVKWVCEEKPAEPKCHRGAAEGARAEPQAGPGNKK